MKFIGFIVGIIVVAQTARPASTDLLRARFYPEKQTYFIGEPVFVVLDLTNTGMQTVWISMSCAWLDTGFEVPTASKPRTINLFGCTQGGVGGSCGGGSREISPGEHYLQRYLLDGIFVLNAAGVYPVRAWHKVDIYTGATDYQVLASQQVTAEFDLSVINGTDEELTAAYASIIRDLKSPDMVTSSLARAAVLQNPTRSVENLLLEWAENPETASGSIGGLKRLATPRAKAKLATLAGAANAEYIRQMAITALAFVGDNAYCSLLLDIAHDSREYSRFIALRAAGYLCGAKALPLITSQLKSVEYSARFEAAYGLGNTHRREAVPVLISLLLDANPEVRRAARDSLGTLTHRISKSGEVPTQAIHRDWTVWWAAKGTTAPIYGIDECKEPEALP